MTLHQDPVAFREAVLGTAATLGLRQDLIEKDYWVTWVLRNLADSAIAGEVVFKGGTSLSKAFKLIERFSEDIDLAVLLQGRTHSQVRALIREVHKAAVAADRPDALAEVVDLGSKMGKNRRVHHRYDRLFMEDSPVATEHILGLR